MENSKHKDSVTVSVGGKNLNGRVYDPTVFGIGLGLVAKKTPMVYL